MLSHDRALGQLSRRPPARQAAEGSGTERQAISGPIAEHDPALAVELFWDLLALAEGVIERCDDSEARVRDFFHQSSAALG